MIGSLLEKLELLNKKQYRISLLDTDFFECNHVPADYKVDRYYSLEKKSWDAIIRHLPIVRSVYAVQKTLSAFKKLIKTKQFDIVIVYQVPGYADTLVEIAHAYKVKIVFEPFGSDILRVSDNERQRLKKAFAEVDGVVGRKKSNVLLASHDVYQVPDNKIFEQRGVVSGVVKLKDLKGKFTRKEMHEAVGVPYSEYNIVCGYSGRESHRHRTIIEALIQVKDVMPEGYQIIFPMTYGAGAHHEIIIHYANDLKAICDGAGLKTIFMTDFKTAEQMALLHLITDLFIEIQPTDNGNAFMIESLYSRNQIVTGSWLNYKRFEQFGVPYYLIDKPSELSEMLHKIFTRQVERAKVPQELVDFFDVPDGYNPGDFWADLFEKL